jgi:hypothetical protein
VWQNDQLPSEDKVQFKFEPTLVNNLKHKYVSSVYVGGNSVIALGHDKASKLVEPLFQTFGEKIKIAEEHATVSV